VVDYPAAARLVNRLTKSNPLDDVPMPLGGLLASAKRALDTELDAVLVAAGHSDLRVAHCPVFEAIDRDGTRLVELAARTGLTKQAMSQLVKHLEQHGYARTEADPADGRAKRVLLTARGWDVFEDALARYLRREQELAERIGRRRYDDLRRTLAELAGGA
jgi:DNA-binding MarR family transcriptional regulator